MASSALESEAAFLERAKTIGVESWALEKLKEKGFASHGKFAFAVPYAPSHTDDRPFLAFLEPHWNPDLTILSLRHCVGYSLSHT